MSTRQRIIVENGRFLPEPGRLETDEEQQARLIRETEEKLAAGSVDVDIVRRRLAAAVQVPIGFLDGTSRGKDE